MGTNFSEFTVQYQLHIKLRYSCSLSHVCISLPNIEPRHLFISLYICNSLTWYVICKITTVVKMKEYIWPVGRIFQQHPTDVKLEYTIWIKGNYFPNILERVHRNPSLPLSPDRVLSARQAGYYSLWKLWGRTIYHLDAF